MDMEPHQRGEHQQLVSVSKKRNSNDAAACLCPTPSAAALLASPASSSARHALEQELLSRTDLQLQQLPAGCDRRRERRMKNRASAERSRARRNAYVNELEAEVRVLRAENEQLKRLCEELKAEAAEVQVPAKKTEAVPRLQRTSSSPF